MPSMYDYIVRQPEILNRVYDRREEYVLPLVELFRTRPIQKIVFTGSGTSNHAAQACASLAERYLPVEAAYPFPTQFIGSNLLEPASTLVVGISQSGNSLSTLGALAYAKEQGCMTLAFSQDPESPLVELCDHYMPLVCEKELVPPETQGYTATLLEWILAIRQCAGVAIDDAMDQLASLPDVIEKSERFVQDNLHELVRSTKMSIAGSGIHYTTAREGALKMGETIHRPIPAYEMEELAHLADLCFEEDNCLLAVVRSQRDQEVVDLVAQITDRIFVFDASFLESDLDADLSLIYAILPFQMAGCLVAKAIGNDTSKYPYEIENISHGEGFIFR